MTGDVHLGEPSFSAKGRIALSRAMAGLDAPRAGATPCTALAQQDGVYGRTEQKEGAGADSRRGVVPHEHGENVP
jgi:hypothetical protein